MDFTIRFGSKTKYNNNILLLKSKKISSRSTLLNLPKCLKKEKDDLFQTVISEKCAISFTSKKLSNNAGEDAFKIYDAFLSKHPENSLYRIWNFIPRINETVNHTEIYKTFNEGRKKAFKKHFKSKYKEKICAATGIDILSDQLIVIFMHGSLKPKHLQNPYQVEPYNYPKIYGVEPPCFSRATSTDSSFFISGTAAITGHESKYENDIVNQTLLTIKNLKTMLSCNINIFENHNSVIYLRNLNHLDIVKKIINTEFPLLKNATYVQANICRKELLIEAEINSF